MKTYIINPDNNKPVTIDEWRKESDPTRAQLLAIETDDAHLLVMSKSYLPGEFTFEEAQKACAAFTPGDQPGLNFRCPTRKECIDIYDARFQGLDEAIELIGGNYARRKSGNRFWTSERDADPRYYASFAWFSYGSVGILNHHYSLFISLLAVPVALLK